MSTSISRKFLNSDSVVYRKMISAITVISRMITKAITKGTASLADISLAVCKLRIIASPAAKADEMGTICDT